MYLRLTGCELKNSLCQTRFVPERHMSRATHKLKTLTCVSWRVSPHACVIESSNFFFSPQEFLSDREQGQSKLNAVVVSGELVSSVAAKDKVDAVRVKMNTAREDWKNMMSNLHNRETSLHVSTLKSDQGSL